MRSTEAVTSGDLQVALEQSLRGIAERTGDHTLPPAGRLYEEDKDRGREVLSTRLMAHYREHATAQAYSLLFDLNAPRFLTIISAQARRISPRIDPNDVLQEVFLAIYRYPHRFRDDCDAAFRNWTSRIIKNAVLKQLRLTSRPGRHEVLLEEFPDAEDQSTHSPLGAVIDKEGTRATREAYILCLAFYMRAFQQLNAREQKALEAVEVDGRSYKATADMLGIKLENLKMVVFRARKKLVREIRREMQT